MYCSLFALGTNGERGVSRFIDSFCLLLKIHWQLSNLYNPEHGCHSPNRKHQRRNHWEIGWAKVSSILLSILHLTYMRTFKLEMSNRVWMCLYGSEEWRGQKYQIGSFQQLNYHMKQEGEWWRSRPRLEPYGIATLKEWPTEEHI